MTQHDLNRQLNFIQQALSQHKRPIGFFIGAGCPLSVRVPATDGDGESSTEPLIGDILWLTQQVHTALTSSDTAKPSTWDKVASLILADTGQEGTIETLLSMVRQLVSIVGVGKARGLNATELEELDRRICRTLSEAVSKSLPDLDTAYHDLGIWIRSLRREKPISIFTTNYDLLMEQALEDSAVPYFDGFVGAKRAFFDHAAVDDESLLHPRWTRLWKIHGSINWQLTEASVVVRSDGLGDKVSQLIYPSHLKYDQSRKMPYLAMLDRLKGFLGTPHSLLFTCGYSFGDDHINDIICRSLEGNPSAHVFALLFGHLETKNYERACLCASSIPNLSVLAEDQGIIGRSCGTWTLQDAQPEYTETGALSVGGEVASLKLGDFRVFGKFLRHVSGEAAVTLE